MIAIDDLYVRIGERIRIAREEQGWTQAQLGEAVGFAQATVAHYELGRRHIKLDDLYRIAAALNKPYAYFIGVDRQVEEETRLRLERQVRKDVADFVGVRMLPILSEPVPMDQPLPEAASDTMIPVARELAGPADCVLSLKGSAGPGLRGGEYIFLNRGADRVPGRVYLAKAGDVLTFVSPSRSGDYAALSGALPKGPVVLIGEFCGLHTQTLQQPPAASPPGESVFPPWERLTAEERAQLRQFAEFLLMKRGD